MIFIAGCSSLKIIRVIYKSLLRKMFGPMSEKMTGKRRSLHKENLCALYSSTNTSQVIKSRRMIWAEYTGCNRRNGPDFGRVFLRSNYTDITQNTHIQISTVTEILAREKSGLLWCLHTVLVSVTSFSPLLELHSYVRANVAPAT